MTQTDTSKATPRPWRTQGRDAIIDTRGEPVAHVFPHKLGGHWTLEEMDAHRSLIVTAVNAYDAMREALRECVQFLDHSGNQRSILARKFATPSGRYDWFQRVKARAHAALAAAEGKVE